MNFKEMFPSRFLKASDSTGPATYTIQRVTMEKMQEELDERKPVLWFAETPKGLVLNKTNGLVLTSILGSEDSEAWIGKRINLVVESAQFKGSLIPCIRVKKAEQVRAPEVPDEDNPVSGIPSAVTQTKPGVFSVDTNLGKFRTAGLDLAKTCRDNIGKALLLHWKKGADSVKELTEVEVLELPF